VAEFLLVPLQLYSQTELVWKAMNFHLWLIQLKVKIKITNTGSFFFLHKNH
jgi:hypothetical protein